MPHRYIDEGAADDVVDAFEGGINILRSSGCTITNIELPDVRTIISAYYITAMAEASSNLRVLMARGMVTALGIRGLWMRCMKIPVPLVSERRSSGG